MQKIISVHCKGPALFEKFKDDAEKKGVDLSHLKLICHFVTELFLEGKGTRKFFRRAAQRVFGGGIQNTIIQGFLDVSPSRLNVVIKKLEAYSQLKKNRDEIQADYDKQLNDSGQLVRVREDVSKDSFPEYRWVEEWRWKTKGIGCEMTAKQKVVELFEVYRTELKNQLKQLKILHQPVVSLSELKRSLKTHEEYRLINKVFTYLNNRLSGKDIDLPNLRKAITNIELQNGVRFSRRMFIDDKLLDDVDKQDRELLLDARDEIVKLKKQINHNNDALSELENQLSKAQTAKQFRDFTQLKSQLQKDRENLSTDLNQRTIQSHDVQSRLRERLNIQVEYFLSQESYVIGALKAAIFDLASDLRVKVDSLDDSLTITCDNKVFCQAINRYKKESMLLLRMKGLRDKSLLDKNIYDTSVVPVATVVPVAKEVPIFKNSKVPSAPPLPQSEHKPEASAPLQYDDYKGPDNKSRESLVGDRVSSALPHALPAVLNPEEEDDEEGLTRSSFAGPEVQGEEKETSSELTVPELLEGLPNVPSHKPRDARSKENNSSEPTVAELLLNLPNAPSYLPQGDRSEGFEEDLQGEEKPVLA
ncbi:hypothetical protein DID75_03005 [Candidatus Marinamargulisbacteria bacterium SCGC AG-410-N11]|nr:hypothetical protein DID75_03005 [Candidatus Marinamargulisbacteria bacterium SCGC AG-410-N11]